MKHHRPIVVALLLTLVASATGQIPLLPGGAAPSAQTEMEKWLADLDAQWQAAFKRDVGARRAAELDKLNAHYLTSVQAGITTAQAAGNLEAALAWRNEQKRFAEANEVPAQDTASDPVPVKKLRAEWRTQVAQIEKNHAARARALHGRYDEFLSQTQTQLTQRGRFDDAVLLKTKRDEVASAWVGGLPAATGEIPKAPPANPAPPSAVKQPGTPGATDFLLPGRISPADVGTRAVGEIVHVEGTVKKIHAPPLSDPGHYFVQLEADVLCEFVAGKVPPFRFTPGGVFYGGSARAVLPIVKVGDRVFVTGHVAGQGAAGATKGPMLRRCLLVVH